MRENLRQVLINHEKVLDILLGKANVTVTTKQLDYAYNLGGVMLVSDRNRKIGLRNALLMLVDQRAIHMYIEEL